MRPALLRRPLGEAAIIEQQLKLTAALADVPIESSCVCRLAS